MSNDQPDDVPAKKSPGRARPATSERETPNDPLFALYGAAPPKKSAKPEPDWLLAYGPNGRHCSGVEQFAATVQRFLQETETPEAKGWILLCDVLRSASLDPGIQASKPAADFLEMILWLAGEAITVTKGDAAFLPLISGLARERAKARHAGTTEAKAWVLGEWVTHAQQYERNKSAFAEDYSRRVLNEKNVKVRARTIREDWLKGH